MSSGNKDTDTASNCIKDFQKIFRSKICDFIIVYLLNKNGLKLFNEMKKRKQFIQNFLLKKLWSSCLKFTVETLFKLKFLKCKKKLDKKRLMLLIEAEAREDEESKENKRPIFSFSDCHSKAWVSLTNESQKLDALICCICNQIANNAMELHCDEHETADQVYLIGEQCLQKYLKQNNGKCPIQQHDYCEFSQNKTVRKSVSELLDNQMKGQNQKEDGENWSESNSNLKNNCNCNYKGKMKDLKDHLDNSCNLIPIKQNITYEITNQLNVMSGQIKELQNVVKDLQLQLKDMKDKENEKNKQIDNLKHELQEKDQTITALKLDNIEFKKQFEQYQIKFEEYKQNIETKVENRTTNIQQLQLQIKTQIDEKQKEQELEKQRLKNCENMLLFIQSSNLKNGVDFLLVTENEQTIKLKNYDWNNYNFGIFLLGEYITLTVACESFGHLKIKTSHLWIKHSSSKIDCSELGYPMNQGPGKGEFKNWSGGGGGYGTKGEGDDGQGGGMHGEATLLKQIHFGSGGGGRFGGSGGGILGLIIEQQLINHGSIQSNGGNGLGGGSGGSILLELQCQSQSHLNKLKQIFGTIKCIGGYGEYDGGKGRIAIYGIELSSDDILKIDPIPFNRLHK
ncbi:keratin, type II cytoskeletal 1-like isoform 6 [Reticulomyxa filosa]|uniref:Keratin, type II cytoskeletal 1-like isoform 6 n=1 Tax=Reticulomyxa filosa TaxID=46433 RepID=X6N5P3_RETFI|nr:keratin, type II cytoskeletal 1-like isoform 6 [Reticulomyxa filosa]|eukprot:ETO20632.1 keratin, type II cytoskeletal 1-like isoform 6 [Reticulomyxa filosa]